MVAVDVEADGKTAVGIDHEFGRRLPACAAQAAGGQNKLILEQMAGDIGDGRGRQAGLLRQRRARHGAVHSNRVQSHPLVMIAGALKIAARKLRPHGAAAARPRPTLRLAK